MIKGEVIYPDGAIVGGALGFCIIVIVLHFVQPGYNPLEQQISELALGKSGSWMIAAFSCLALSLWALQKALHQRGTDIGVRLCLMSAALSLFGAGIFRLDNGPNTHITLVTVAFVLIGLVMYLLPMHVSKMDATEHKITSWSLGICTAGFVASGQFGLPMGISQRGAILCILLWLIWLSGCFFTSSPKT